MKAKNHSKRSEIVGKKFTSRLFKASEVAEIFRCSTDLVYQMIDEGQLPGAFRLRPGRASSYRIPADAHEVLKAAAKES